MENSFDMIEGTLSISNSEHLHGAHGAIIDNKVLTAQENEVYATVVHIMEQNSQMKHIVLDNYEKLQVLEITFYDYKKHNTVSSYIYLIFDACVLVNEDYWC